MNEGGKGQKTSGSAPEPGQVVAPGGKAEAVPPEAPDTTAHNKADPIPQSPAELPAPQPPDFYGDPDQQVTWTAAEFIAHEKSSGWYGTLALITIIIAAVLYLLTRDIISTVVIIVGGFCFGVLASRKPRQLQYAVGDTGIVIGSKHYDYGMFKSFSVVPEGASGSIIFMPLKRFAPLTIMYFDPKDHDKIVDILADYLPFEEHRLDIVDNVMRRIRF